MLGVCLLVLGSKRLYGSTGLVMTTLCQRGICCPGVAKRCVCVCWDEVMLCSRVTVASVSVGERFETTKLIDGVTECQLGAGNGNRKTHDDVTDDQKRKKTGAVAKRLDGSSCLVMITTTLCCSSVFVRHVW